MELRSAAIIDAEIEGDYAYYPFADGISTRYHTHDFYEIFLIAGGSIQHEINDERQHLTRGALVFIRPNDAHCFQQDGDENCTLINLAFLTQTFSAVVAFLEFNRNLLTVSPLPPVTYLDDPEVEILAGQLESWGRSLYGDKRDSRQTLRGLLAYILGKYFIVQAATLANPIPFWLREVTQAMHEPAHFIEGRDALLRLAQRSPEYVGRQFKQHLNVTPSEFINALRLDYAGDRLLHTTDSPMDIAYQAGFGNLSHFYHLFKERWQCSPNEFRKRYQRNAIP